MFRHSTAKLANRVWAILAKVSLSTRAEVIPGTDAGLGDAG
jgi:hypothetical protein